MGKRRKILFIIPSLVGGGAENALIKLLKVFDHENYAVTLLVVSYNGAYLDKVPKRVKVIYLFRRDMVVRVLAFIQKKIGIDWGFKWVFRQKVREDFDTAVSFLDSNFTDLLFYLKDETKKISWVHSSYKSNQNFYKFYRNRSYRKRLIKNRYSRLDTIVFVSYDAKREFHEIFGGFKDMRVLYNLFEGDEIRRKASAFKVDRPKEKIVFITVGSLIPVKGYELLIDAAGIMAEKGHPFQLHIIGGGHQEKALQQKVAALGLEDRILFLGYQSNPFPYLKAADLFVMTSVSEALPSALCEAIILGKATLVTRTSGCREVIADGRYGMLTERRADAFAAKMIACATDKTLIARFEARSKERRRIFDQTDTLGKYYEIL